MDINYLIKIMIQLIIHAREGLVHYSLDAGLADTTCANLIDGANRLQDHLLAHEFNSNPEHRKHAVDESEFIKLNRINFLDIAKMSEELRKESRLLNQRIVLHLVNAAQNISHIPSELISMADPASPMQIYKLNCPLKGHQPPSCEDIIKDKLNWYGNLPHMDIVDICQSSSSSSWPLSTTTTGGSQLQQFNWLQKNITTLITVATDKQTGIMQINVTHPVSKKVEKGYLYAQRTFDSDKCRFRCYQNRMDKLGKESHKLPHFNQTKLFQMHPNCLKCVPPAVASDPEQQPKMEQLQSLEWKPTLIDWIIYSSPFCILFLYWMSLNWFEWTTTCKLRFSPRTIWAIIFAATFSMRHLQAKTQLILNWLGLERVRRWICFVEALFYVSQMSLLVSITFLRYTNWWKSLSFQMGGLIVVAVYKFIVVDTSPLEECIKLADTGVVGAFITIQVLITMFSSRQLVYNDLRPVVVAFRSATTTTTSDTMPSSVANTILCLLLDVWALASLHSTFGGQQKWFQYLTEPQDFSSTAVVLTILRSMEFRSADADEESN